MNKKSYIITLAALLLLSSCGKNTDTMTSTEETQVITSSEEDVSDDETYTFNIDEELSDYGKQVLDEHQNDERIQAYLQGVEILKDISGKSGNDLQNGLKELVPLVSKLHTASSRKNIVEDIEDFQEAREQRNNNALRSIDIAHIYYQLVSLVMEVAAEEYVDPYPIHVNVMDYVSMMENLGYHVERKESIADITYNFYENESDEQSAAALYLDRNGTAREAAVKLHIVPSIVKTDADMAAYQDLSAEERNEICAKNIYDSIQTINESEFVVSPDPRIGYILSTDELKQLFKFLKQYEKDDWKNFLSNNDNIDYTGFLIQTNAHILDIRSVMGNITIYEVFGVDYFKRNPPSVSVTNNDAKKYSTLEEFASTLNNTYSYICEDISEDEILSENDAEENLIPDDTIKIQYADYDEQWYKNIGTLSQGDNTMTFYWSDDGTVSIEINGISMYDFDGNDYESGNDGYEYLSYDIEYEEFTLNYYPTEENSPVQLTGGEYAGYYSK